jgi:hypothetical protein
MASTVHLQTPANGIVFIQTHPVDTVEGLMGYAKSFSKAMKQDIPFEKISSPVFYRRRHLA